MNHRSSTYQHEVHPSLFLYETSDNNDLVLRLIRILLAETQWVSACIMIPFHGDAHRDIIINGWYGRSNPRAGFSTQSIRMEHWIWSSWRCFTMLEVEFTNFYLWGLLLYGFLGNFRGTIQIFTAHIGFIINGSSWFSVLNIVICGHIPSEETPTLRNISQLSIVVPRFRFRGSNAKRRNMRLSPQMIWLKFHGVSRLFPLRWLYGGVLK